MKLSAKPKEPRLMPKTIKISIENNSDLKEAMKLKKDGYEFHIQKINFLGIDNDSLTLLEKELWDELGKEAWENHGNINEKKE